MSSDRKGHPSFSSSSSSSVPGGGGGGGGTGGRPDDRRKYNEPWKYSKTNNNNNNNNIEGPNNGSIGNNNSASGNGIAPSGRQPPYFKSKYASGNNYRGNNLGSSGNGTGINNNASGSAGEGGRSYYSSYHNNSYSGKGRYGNGSYRPNSSSAIPSSSPAPSSSASSTSAPHQQQAHQTHGHGQVPPPAAKSYSSSSSIPPASSVNAGPTTNNTQQQSQQGPAPHFQRYRSYQGDSSSAGPAAGPNKRAGDLINNRSGSHSSSSSFYDSRADSYRFGSSGGRYYGGSYRDRERDRDRDRDYPGYRGYGQRKSSNEHYFSRDKNYHHPYHHHTNSNNPNHPLARQQQQQQQQQQQDTGSINDEEDLIYGSIKPKSSTSKPSSRPQSISSSSTTTNTTAADADAGAGAVQQPSAVTLKEESTTKDIVTKPKAEDSAKDKAVQDEQAEAEAEAEAEVPSSNNDQESKKLEEESKVEQAENTQASSTVATAEEEQEAVKAPVEDTEKEKALNRDEEQQSEEKQESAEEDKMDIDTSPPPPPLEETKTARRSSTVSSDSYDPAAEAAISETIIPAVDTGVKVEIIIPNASTDTVTIPTATSKPSLISSLKEDDQEEAQEEEEKELEEAVLNSSQNVFGDEEELQHNYLPKDLLTSGAAIFPMNRLETKLWELKQNQKLTIRSKLPHLRSQPLQNFSSYPFFKSNILIHEQAIKPNLSQNFQILKKAISLKSKALFVEMHEKKDIWNSRVDFMERQLKEFHPNSSAYASNNQTADAKTPAGPTVSQTLEQHQQKEQQSTPITSSRRNRNTGVVNSEAEFAEILQRMKEEEENDPVYKAKQAAAIIPEMNLDPITKNAFKFIDTNNLVTNLADWESRLITDKIDNFSEQEHAMFCEAYASYPKRFGKISATMFHKRTPRECVLHYYRTKRTTNYKQLVAAKNKRSGRKAGAAKSRKAATSKSKTGTATNNTPTVATPVATSQQEYFTKDDQAAQKSEEPHEETNDQEVVYTDTGRRKRAAAPTFDSSSSSQQQQQQAELEQQQQANKKRTVSNRNLEEVNKKLEDTTTAAASSVTTTATNKAKKQRTSKKKEEALEPSTSVDQIDRRNSVAAVTGVPVPAAIPATNATTVSSNVDQPISTNVVANPPVFAAAPVQPQVQSQSAQVQIPQVSQAPMQDSMPASVAPLKQEMEVDHPMTETTISGKVSKKDKKPPHITSYWSINDANKFPAILAECGTQWHLIAKKIQTKTTTMVRNYYSKNANAENNWVQIAREADARKMREQGITTEAYFDQAQQVAELAQLQQQREKQNEGYHRSYVPSSAPSYSIEHQQHHHHHMHHQQQQQQQHQSPPVQQQPPMMALPSLKDITLPMGGGNGNSAVGSGESYNSSNSANYPFRHHQTPSPPPHHSLHNHTHQHSTASVGSVAAIAPPLGSFATSNHNHPRASTASATMTNTAPTMSNLLSSRDDDRKPFSILNDNYSSQSQSHTHSAHQHQPPPTFQSSSSASRPAFVPSQPAPPPSRTSIMSLLNSEPTQSAPAVPLQHQQQPPPQPQPQQSHASPLNNILNNSTTAPAPAHSQQQPPPQLPHARGLFSLAALAEVATDNYGNQNYAADSHHTNNNNNNNNNHNAR